LVDAHLGFSRRGGELKLAGPNSLCTDILFVSGIFRHFEIYLDVRSAVRSFLQ
jgi:hypothetical protein